MQRFLEWNAKDFMTRNVVTVEPNVALAQLEALFSNHDFNAFPVVEGKHVMGVVTKFDFLKAFVFTTQAVVPHYGDLMGRTVRDIMTREAVYVQPDVPLTRVLEQMIEMKARSFPVLDEGGKLAGIISREDLMRALRQSAGTA
jgi:CBS-domain-containing membrane protein